MVVLTNVPDMAELLVALAAPANPPVTIGADQLYTVPAGVPVGINVKRVPLQVIAVIALTEAAGVMVAVTVNAFPLQLPDKGVIV